MSPADFLPFTIACLIMTLLGYFITALLSGDHLSTPLRWALAPATGAGICSLIVFVFRRPMFTIEFALLIVLAAVWLLKHGIRLPDFSSLTTWRAPVIALLLAGALGLASSESLARIQRSPHGDWDAWAIWNSHARYLYRDGPNWQEHIQNTFHPDYPLLVPSMTVRLWRYTGYDVPDMGGVFGIGFGLCGVILLAAALAEVRRPSTGMLMALLLVGTPFYLAHAVDQDADIPLSVFFLATIALVYVERMTDRRSLLVLAGFMAGCAGWTKNEGLVLILATITALAFPVFWKPSATMRRMAAFLSGLALPLALIVFFKITIAPPGDITANRHYQEIIEKILTPDRYLITMGNFLRTSWTFGGWTLQPMIPLLAYIALKGIDRQTVRSSGWLSGVAILSIVLAGYYSVYILTPMDLQWHLDSSLERLLMHFWPSGLFLAGLTARHAESGLGPG